MIIPPPLPSIIDHSPHLSPIAHPTQLARSKQNEVDVDFLHRLGTVILRRPLM
jgi:hypothetical protein